MSAVLRASGIDVRYGGVQALQDVTLEVEPAQLVGLIGPNGAGKTTFIDAITGFTACTGRIELDGKDIARLPPSERARRGLVRTWQAAALFDELSVLENLTAVSPSPSLRELIRQFARGAAPRNPLVEELLSRFGLEAVADALPSELTQGQRKLVGVARALAASPTVVCLDEPAAGLDTMETEVLGRHLREVVAGGTSILLVDHDMGLVLGACDHVVVLELVA